MIRRLVRFRFVFLFAVLAICTAPHADTLPGARRQQIVLPGIGGLGIFDPSIAETPPGGRVWMSYSAVDPSPNWPMRNSRTVTTRLAYSDNHGASWSDIGAVINPIKETVGGPEQRTWNSEVSSLVFDPTAPAPARWKLFWHHYAAIGEDRQFQHGWIAYKESPSPEGLRAAAEIKLFGANGYDKVNDSLSGATGSPIAGPPRIRLAALGAGANSCIALSEPDVMATPAGLYMTVGCYGFRLVPPGVESRILLLKCGAPCEPTSEASWRVIGPVLTERNARSLGARSFSASDLFSYDGARYLVVSPVGNRPFPNSYNGCYVFRFSDLEAGALESSGGTPTLIKEIHGLTGTFNGACTFAQNALSAGFLYSELKLAKPPIFQIFKTGDRLP